MTACGAAAYRVLVILAERADPYGYGAWFGQEKLAESLECSTRTIRRALRELLDAGLIRKGDQSLVKGRADRRPTVYDVMTPALRIRESREDSPVHPCGSRVDSFRSHGRTTGVHRTTHEPTYQDTQHHLAYSTARESVMSR
jgi:DNA-binding transcriptional regulator YhcF (GntR family)